jgi:hypothetical protein
VISSLALSVLAAGVVARRPAVEVEAGAVQRTLTVVYALSCTHSSQIRKIFHMCRRYNLGETKQKMIFYELKQSLNLPPV